MLTELHKDGLAEIVNIAVGQGANILSEMTGRKVELSVPFIELLSTQEMNTSVLSRTAVPNGHVISSSLKFGQGFKGKAFLLFPARQAKQLVALCLGEDEPMGLSERDLLDTDFDVLKEIGNVILNCIVGGLGNFLACKLTYSLPEIEMLFVSPEGQRTLLQDQLHVLVLHTCFRLAATQIEGTILIALSMESIAQLSERLDQFLEELE
ncbi:MAG: chemotaxis protein CheC [Negativicutes bacterium]|nr:chemotaxis protein CheC [Negativicutes bacterium]